MFPAGMTEVAGSCCPPMDQLADAAPEPGLCLARSQGTHIAPVEGHEQVAAIRGLIEGLLHDPVYLASTDRLAVRHLHHGPIERVEEVRIIAVG